MGRAVGRPKTTSKFLLFYRCRKQIHHCNGPNGDRFTTRMLIFFQTAGSLTSQQKTSWSEKHKIHTALPLHFLFDFPLSCFARGRQPDFCYLSGDNQEQQLHNLPNSSVATRWNRTREETADHHSVILRLLFFRNVGYV